MHAIGRIPNRGRFQALIGQALIGAVLAALLLAASPASGSTLAAPTLSATAGNRWVRLTWTESYSATAYEWRKSTDGGTTWGDWIEMPFEAVRARAGTVPLLTNGVAYTFQVRAARQNAKPTGLGGFSNVVTEFSDPSNSVTATPGA